MRKDIIIMTPTINRAVYEFKVFLSKYPTIIKRTNKAKLYIELLSGRKIYFKTRTQELLGLHTDFKSIDEFLKEDFYKC